MTAPGKSPSPANAQLHVWAASILQARPDATPTQMQNAFLRKLAQQQFVPTTELVDALEAAQRPALAWPEADLPTDYRLHVHEIATAELAEFADQFFELQPSARVERWTTLRNKYYAHPAIVAHLDAIKPGLNVQRPDAIDEDSKTIVECACKLYSLNPIQRASVAREFWALARQDPDRFQSAGRRFQSAHREFAQLLPAFFRRLCNFRKLLRTEDRKRNKPRRVRRTAPIHRSSFRRQHMTTFAAPLLICSCLFFFRYYLTVKDPEPPRRSNIPAAVPKDIRIPLTSDAMLRYLEGDQRTNGPGSSALLRLSSELATLRAAYRRDLEKIDQQYPEFASSNRLTAVIDPNVSMRSRLERDKRFLQRELELTNLRAKHLPQFQTQWDVKRTEINTDLQAVEQRIAELPPGAGDSAAGDSAAGDSAADESAPQHSPSQSAPRAKE